MKISYFLSFAVFIFSHFVYSNGCENSFLDTVTQNVRRIYNDLQSKNTETQFQALREVRTINPDIEAINQLILPFLQSKSPRVRFAALKVIGDSINIFPQAVGALLLHVRQEPSLSIKKWITRKIQHIPSNEKQAFYQGRKIVEAITQLNAHFTQINHWFNSILGIKDLQTAQTIVNIALQKQEKDRTPIERESIRLYEKTEVLTTSFKNLLLSLPYKTHMELMGSFYYYIHYTEQLVIIHKDVNIFIYFFYENLHNISSSK